jgi:hypothetical protein
VNIYRQLRGLSPEEQAALLISKGLTAEEAQDWLLNYEQNRNILKPRAEAAKFTESPKWKDIQERAKRLGSEQTNQMQRMREGVPPQASPPDVLRQVQE